MTILDRDPEVLEKLGIHFESRAKTRFSNRANIEQMICEAELVIGAVLMNPEIFFSVNSILTAEAFYILRNDYVWEAIERLAERRRVPGICRPLTCFAPRRRGGFVTAGSDLATVLQAWKAR